MSIEKEEVIMATKSANVMARVEPDVKKKAEEIMARIGVPASVVINALYHQVIYKNGIPFPLTAPPQVPALENMSEEDFNRMMEVSLSQAMNGEGKSADEVFDSLRNSIK